MQAVHALSESDRAARDHSASTHARGGMRMQSALLDCVAIAVSAARPASVERETTRAHGARAA